MAYSTTSLNLTSATGWTYNPAQLGFTAGGLATLAGFHGTALATSPGITTSTWAVTSRATMAIAEEIGYSHLFLVSFDGGTTWNRFGPAGWQRIPSALIGTLGMTFGDLGNVRNWPDPASTGPLMVKVQIVRALGASVGAWTAFTVYHKTVTTKEAASDAAYTFLPIDITEPASTADLVTTLAPYLPSLPIQPQMMTALASMQTASGYVQNWRLQSGRRYSFPMTWKALDSDGLAAVKPFVLIHHKNAFNYTAPGFASKKWVFADDEKIVPVSKGVWNVSVTAVEVL